VVVPATVLFGLHVLESRTLALAQAYKGRVASSKAFTTTESMILGIIRALAYIWENRT
jgi:hypothetical protein